MLNMNDTMLPQRSAVERYTVPPAGSRTGGGAEAYARIDLSALLRGVGFRDELRERYLCELRIGVEGVQVRICQLLGFHQQVPVQR